jgi:hypothetical protein
MMSEHFGTKYLTADEFHRLLKDDATRAITYAIGDLARGALYSSDIGHLRKWVQHYAANGLGCLTQRKLLDLYGGAGGRKFEYIFTKVARKDEPK